MPQAQTPDGLRIHYAVEGSGPAIAMVHGFSGNGQIWERIGFVTALRDDCRLLLIDLRGHGKSDKPHDSTAYAPELFVSDITSVLDSEDIESAVYWGYSMGGRMGFAALKHAPERFPVALLGGAHPYDNNVTRLNEMIANLEQGTEVMAQRHEQMLGRALTDEERQLLLANDTVALAECARTLHAPICSDRELRAMTAPTLIYRGSEDDDWAPVAEVQACIDAMPHAELCSLHGQGHGLTHPEAFLPTARAFLARNL